MKVDIRFREALTAECGLEGLETLGGEAAGQGNAVPGQPLGKGMVPPQRGTVCSCHQNGTIS